MINPLQSNLGAGVLLALVASTGAYFSGRAHGERAANADRAAEVAEAYEQARRVESDAAREVETIRAEVARTEAREAKTDYETVDGMASGSDNLRLPVQASDCPDRAASTTAAARSVDGTRNAKLAPATAAALWRIAADGDRAIRKLTKLQEWARTAMKVCGKYGEPIPE